MKIGILTQPLHNNYGGLLQNYALQIALRQMGHDPVTIDIPYSEPKWSPYARFVKTIWRWLKKLGGDCSVLFCDLKRQWEFMNRPGMEQSRFIASHIDVLHMPDSLSTEFCNQYDFEAYIVGSDQIWRPRFSPCLLNYFLDFTEGTEVKRIAYAASFGTDRWEGCAGETLRIAQLAQKFDSISVREKSGISLCRSIFGVDAQWVLDPTLLLPKEEYEKLLSSISRPIEKPYLAIYALDINSTMDKLIKKVCTGKKLIPVFIGRRRKTGYPSIESWLKGIFCSDYVITDSFHGTIFSIIAHRPFTTVVNTGRGASRLESLLGSINLMDRLTVSGELPNVDTPIDYNDVDSRLAAYREHSLEYLVNLKK